MGCARCGETIGSLEVGKGADMVLIDWDQVAYPYLDELTPTLDAVVQRAKNQAVTMTMCDGEVIYQDGKFTKVDRTAALKALHDDLSKALADDEVERRELSVALLPYARKFYERWRCCPMRGSSTRTTSIPRSTSPSIGRVRRRSSPMTTAGQIADTQDLSPHHLAPKALPCSCTVCVYHLKSCTKGAWNCWRLHPLAQWYLYNRAVAKNSPTEAFLYWTWYRSDFEDLFNKFGLGSFCSGCPIERALLEF